MLFTNVTVPETLDSLKSRLEEDSTLGHGTNLNVESVLGLTQLCVQTPYGYSIHQQNKEQLWVLHLESLRTRILEKVFKWFWKAL
jgi:hypothetical protein